MNSSKLWPCAALQRASLADRTTLRVGGEVAWLLEPSHPDELVAAWQAALDAGHRPDVLGGGANLIVEDGEHERVVVATERMTRVFRLRPDSDAGNAAEKSDGNHDPFQVQLPPLTPADDEDEPVLVAWAGAGMPGLVRTARELGWSGLEGLAGVPGHLGGGVAMNAGGRWGELWDVIETVRFLQADGVVVDLPRHECTPSYRNGNLGPGVVLGAVLRLERSDRASVHERSRQYLAEKSAAQPVTERSCGCIFKNPDPELSDGRGAGKLVEVSGAKGLERGDAIVSPKHGNFIVNRGAARATDVLGLIEEVTRRVADKTGIILELEAKVWRRA